MTTDERIAALEEIVKQLAADLAAHGRTGHITWVPAITHPAAAPPNSYSFDPTAPNSIKLGG